MYQSPNKNQISLVSLAVWCLLADEQVISTVSKYIGICCLPIRKCCDFKIFNLLLFIALCGITISVGAQEFNCNTSFKEAGAHYRNGQYQLTINILQKALDSCDLSKRDFEEMNLLLAQACLENRNYTEAKTALHAVLKKNRHFKLKKDLYQEDMYHYFNTLTVFPVLSFGTQAHVVVSPSTFSLPGVTNALGEVITNLSVPFKGSGLSPFLETQFYPNMAVLVWLNVSSASREFEDAAAVVNENFLLWENGFSLKKYFSRAGPKSKQGIKPYIGVGYYSGGMNHTYEVNQNQGASQDTDNISSSGSDKVKRNGVIPLFGFQYRFKRTYISWESRYFQDLNKISSDVVRFSKLELSMQLIYPLKYGVHKKYKK